MTEKEAARLRTVYRVWMTQRLAQAATIGKGDYQSEAVALILEELKRRNITGDDLAKFSSAPPQPPGDGKNERNTLMMPARLNRKQYAIRFSIWFVAVFGVGWLLEFAPRLQPGAAIAWFMVAIIYKIVCLDIPRLKNAGLEPYVILFSILLFVPLANLVALVILFAAPPKK